MVEKTIGDVQQHYNANVMIRTKQMMVGLPSYWSYKDVAHIWINGELFRITDKGSLIKADVPSPTQPPVAQEKRGGYSPRRARMHDTTKGSDEDVR